MYLIRQALAELRLKDLVTKKEIIRDAISYLNRQSDHEQVRTAMKKRFGVSRKIVKDPGDGTGTTQTYVRGEFSDQVDSGQIENFSIGFAEKVINASATLFTEKSQKFSLNHEVKDTDTTKAEDLLFEQNRGASNFSSVMVESNKLSVGIGSAGVFVEWARGHLTYKKLSPSDVDVYFADYIEEEGKPRGVDRTDIEDATAVVINLGTNDDITHNYVAIMGRAKGLDNGRYLQFQGNSTITSIPKIGSPDVMFEHEMEGKPANPLTYWGNQPENKDKDIPEYPIAIIKGGFTEQNEPFPVYTSLYEAGVEFDISASHIETSGQDAATGTKALNQPKEAMGHPIPPSLRGQVCLIMGQTITEHPDDSASIKVAMENTGMNMLHCASGYSVPDYDVVSLDHTVEASSGIALAIKSKPKEKQREYCIDLNRPQVTKLFEIEKAYIGIHASNENDPAVTLLQECTQTWDPGELVLPENKKEATDRNKILMESGAIDMIEFIRREHQLPSDEEAKAMYETMKERQDEFPPLIKEEEKAKPDLRLKKRRTGAEF